MAFLTLLCCSLLLAGQWQLSHAQINMDISEIEYKITKKTIDDESREEMLELDDDDAFSSFINLYDDIEPVGFRASQDPEALAAIRAQQKAVFKKNIVGIKAHNKRFKMGQETYEMAVNSFIVMDETNRQAFLGLGQSGTSLGPGGVLGTSVASNYNVSASFGLGASRRALKSSIDHRSRLPAMKNQGNCGSCWTYPTVALVEHAYQRSTGKVIALSEQEMLDCTYEANNYDGCGGGWYYQAWDWIIKNNHLASQKDYPYQGRDGACYKSYYSSAIANKVKVNSYFKVGASSVTQQLQSQPLAVAFYVENSFFSYRNGIFSACYTQTHSNHAVTLTGYGSNYWEIRNSWGADWGNGGYGKFQRSGTSSPCNLLDDVYGIKWTDLDDGDGGDDTDDGDVDPDDGDGDCVDSDPTNCPGWASSDYCRKGDYVDWMKTNCKKSCGECRDDSDNGECEDQDSNCSGWAADGFCKGKYGEWMQENCAASCGGCDDGGDEDESNDGDCTDVESDCGGWASDGFCKGKYAEWMSKNCAKSCGKCKDGDDDNEPDDPDDDDDDNSGDCVDKNDKCTKWKNAGYCSSPDYRDYMITNCQKSCGSCFDDNDGDEDGSDESGGGEEYLPAKKVSQSSTLTWRGDKKIADYAVDGDDSTASHTMCDRRNPASFIYELGDSYSIARVEILNGRYDSKRMRQDGAEVMLYGDDEPVGIPCGTLQVQSGNSKEEQTYSIDCGGQVGSSVVIKQSNKFKGKMCLELKEVRVYAAAESGTEGGSEGGSESGSEGYEPDPNPNPDPVPDDDCKDVEGDCASWAASGYCSGTYGEWMKENCAKSCNKCGGGDDDDGSCPGGTTMCPDGFCKHIHMC